MRAKSEALWVGLLAVMQLGDVWTTSLDRAKGAVEGMPLSAVVLAHEGLLGFAAVKMLGLVAATAAVALTYLLSRRSSRSQRLHRTTMNGLRVIVVAIALTSLHNAVLFEQL